MGNPHLRLDEGQVPVAHEVREQRHGAATGCGGDRVLAHGDAALQLSRVPPGLVHGGVAEPAQLDLAVPPAVVAVPRGVVELPGGRGTRITSLWALRLSRRIGAARAGRGAGGPVGSDECLDVLDAVAEVLAAQAHVMRVFPGSPHRSSARGGSRPGCRLPGGGVTSTARDANCSSSCSGAADALVRAARAAGVLGRPVAGVAAPTSGRGAAGGRAGTAGSGSSSCSGSGGVVVEVARATVR